MATLSNITDWSSKTKAGTRLKGDIARYLSVLCSEISFFDDFMIFPDDFHEISVGFDQKQHHPRPIFLHTEFQNGPIDLISFLNERYVLCGY